MAPADSTSALAQWPAYLHDKGMQSVALAARHAELSKHHRVSGCLAQVADPKLGGFKIRGMYDEFLPKTKKLKSQ